MALKDSDYGIWINRDKEKYTHTVSAIVPMTNGRHYYTYKTSMADNKTFFTHGLSRDDNKFVIVAPKHLGEWL